MNEQRPDKAGDNAFKGAELIYSIDLIQEAGYNPDKTEDQEK
jgi:hypothetical protein